MWSSKQKNYLLILLLSLITFGVYLNSLSGDYLIDDYSGILNNPQIQDIKTYFAKHFRLKNSILDELLHVFTWYFSGGKTFAFHLVNLFGHILCVISLFIICNILFKNLTLSFLTSLIFAVHPIHTEAVSWISGGHYVFSSLFFIVATIFYIKSNASLFYLSLAIIFFVLCLFSGNAVGTLPLMFIAYDIFFREKSKEKKALRVFRFGMLFLIVGIVLLFIARVFVTTDKSIHAIFYFKNYRYLIVALKALVYYLKIIYLPIKRGLYHTFAYTTVGMDRISPAFFISLTVIFMSIFSFFRFKKNAKPLSFGIAWFFITYLPYANFIPVCNIISERYVYLPSVGTSLILAYLFLRVWEMINQDGKFKRKQVFRILAMVSIVLFILSYAILTLKHNRDYRDVLTYWESNINNFPDGYLAFNNLAGSLYLSGDKEEAKKYCWVSLMVNPKQPHVWCNLGKIYREEGDLKWADYCYRQALKVAPTFYPALAPLDEIAKELKENKN